MVTRKTYDSLRLILMIATAIIIGFMVGVYVSLLAVSQLNVVSYLPMVNQPIQLSVCSPVHKTSLQAEVREMQLSEGIRHNQTTNDTMKMPIRIQSHPKGAERLPPSIVASQSDLYLRRLWGDPKEDLPHKPKYLVAFAVGQNMMYYVNAAVQKFSSNFTILLFHYDGKTTEWDQYEWSKNAIHVSVRKQTKWWYAKRFLHPDIVAPYDYIFIWDEDLGVQNFDSEKYIELVKKHGLEISQPALDPKSPYFTWQMTRKRNDSEVHKVTEEEPGRCKDPLQPPCAAFIEIMAPVFSRDAWTCVWHMIQNDLVHGWGLDFALQKCVAPAYEKIGVVDAQWIYHETIPSLGNQGKASNGTSPWQAVRNRCEKEWKMFDNRLNSAEKVQ